MLKNWRCFILVAKRYREKGGGVKYYDPCEVGLQQDFRSPPPAGLETLASTLYGQAWIIQSTHSSKFSWSLVQRHKSSVFNLSPRLKRETLYKAGSPLKWFTKHFTPRTFPISILPILSANYTTTILLYHALFRVKHKSLSQFEVWSKK